MYPSMPVVGRIPPILLHLWIPAQMESIRQKKRASPFVESGGPVVHIIKS